MSARPGRAPVAGQIERIHAPAKLAEVAGKFVVASAVLTQTVQEKDNAAGSGNLPGASEKLRATPGLPEPLQLLYLHRCTQSQSQPPPITLTRVLREARPAIKGENADSAPAKLISASRAPIRPSQG